MFSAVGIQLQLQLLSGRDCSGIGCCHSLPLFLGALGAGLGLPTAALPAAAALAAGLLAVMLAAVVGALSTVFELPHFWTVPPLKLTVLQLPHIKKA